MPEADTPVDWMYVVDAKTGTILRHYRMILSVTGLAKVYYTFSCNNSPQQATLYNLDQSGYIQGTNVIVYAGLYDRAFVSNQDFRYDPSSTHFDEANVYYYLEIAHTYWGSYIVNQPVTAIVHATSPPPCNGGWTEGSIQYRDDCPTAREDKISYHEYSHFATAILGVNFYGTINEPGGISEGMADFFAEDYTNRPVILDCADPGIERDMTNPCYTSYASYYADFLRTGNVDPHNSGQLWSACLWDLRVNLYSTVKSLVMASIPSLTNTSSFSIGRQKIIEQDRIQNGGVHSQYIAHKFFARGIDYDSLGNPSIMGPGCLQLKQNGTWTASVAGGSQSFSYQWYYEDQYSGGLDCAWVGSISEPNNEWPLV
jgi:hypothetical protein